MWQLCTHIAESLDLSSANVECSYRTGQQVSAFLEYSIRVSEEDVGSFVQKMSNDVPRDLELSLRGDGDLTAEVTSNSRPSSGGASSKSTASIAVPVAAAAGCLVLLLVVIGVLWIRKRRIQSKQSPATLHRIFSRDSPGCQELTGVITSGQNDSFREPTQPPPVPKATRRPTDWGEHDAPIYEDLDAYEVPISCTATCSTRTVAPSGVMYEVPVVKLHADMPGTPTQQHTTGSPQTTGRRMTRPNSYILHENGPESPVQGPGDTNVNLQQKRVRHLGDDLDQATVTERHYSVADDLPA